MANITSAPRDNYKVAKQLTMPAKPESGPPGGIKDTVTHATTGQTGYMDPANNIWVLDPSGKLVQLGPHTEDWKTGSGFVPAQEPTPITGVQ